MYDAGAVALASALRDNSALEELTLGYNRISDAGAEALAGALGSVPKLRVLSLEGNSIGDSGAAALAAGLFHVPLLKEVNLFWNLIGPTGVTALSEALGSVPRLARLSLSWNHLADAGAADLGKALSLEGAPQLEDLRVDWCDIGDAGARALATGLRNQWNLTLLKVKRNLFSSGGSTAIAMAVADLEQARGLPLDCYGVPSTTLESFRSGANSSTLAMPAPPVHAAPEPAVATEVVQSEPAASESTVATEVERSEATAPEPDRTTETLQTKPAKLELGMATETMQTRHAELAGSSTGLTCSSRACKALLIANANYPSQVLNSATLEEASVLEQTLMRLGFGVKSVLDGKRAKILAAINNVTNALGPDDIVFLMYSGYILSNDSTMSLLPVDYATTAGQAKKKKKAKSKPPISIPSVLRNMSKDRSNGGVVLIVDAVNIGNTSIIDFPAVLTPPTGSLVAVATNSTAVRHDADEVSLVHILADELENRPGLFVEQLFRRVGTRLTEQSQHAAPAFWTASALSVDFLPNAASKVEI